MIHDLINISEEGLRSLPDAINSLYSNDSRLIKRKALKDKHQEKLLENIEKYLNSILKVQLKELPSIKNHKIGAFTRRQIFDQIQGHLTFTYILKLDVKDFYESLSWGVLQTIFDRVPALDDSHIRLIQEIYFHRGYLARGLMNSSLIAEFFLASVDDYVHKLLHETSLGDNEYHFSRYYDDFFISTHDKDKLQSIKTSLIDKLGQSSLRVNADKTKIVRTNNTKILGLSLSNGEIHPPRYLKQQLYELENAYCSYDESSATEVYKKMSICGSIKGTLHYIVNNSSSHPMRYEYALREYNGELSRLHTRLEEMLEDGK